MENPAFIKNLDMVVSSGEGRSSHDAHAHLMHEPEHLGMPL
jgi:hypothetical protein